MFKPRIIPVLLLKDNALIKSQKFKDYKYIGDPINAVRIFNDLKADELAFFDISATAENRLISLEFVKNVGEEANMPFAVGGGIKSVEDIRSIIGAGSEKVIINSFAVENPDFILHASKTFGTSTIVVCMDVKDHKVWAKNGSKATPYTPIDFAKLMEENGAGEIVVQSIEQDGMMNGYDIKLIKNISEAVSIPVIALGGAGNLQHMKQAYTEGYASALAAGSMFVFHGSKRGVLINYPDKTEILF